VSGFDIRINFPGAPLFLQYKLPELMQRGTAFETANWHCPGLSVLFFRIAMSVPSLSKIRPANGLIPSLPPVKL
jgi:hypothetical protein